MAAEPGVKRPLLDRVLVRMPRVSRAVLEVMRRLPPGFFARRRFVAWAVRRSLRSYERMDVAFNALLYEPDVEIRLKGADGLGLSDRYVGEEGWRQYLGDLYENFSEPRLRLVRILDAGDRFVLVFIFSGRGSASGVAIELQVASVIRLAPGGLIASQDLLWNGTWEQALEAAGLPAAS
jgi:ketosteroid isomerase-like protein